MIAKEADPSSSTDKMTQAGQRAERQLAFYLRRAFERDGDVIVFNGIRLEHQLRPEDAAQIDHLIVHRRGFVLIESKSVHDTIEINEHGEFSRWFGGRPHGMGSPIEQVKRQEQFLRRYLQDHAELILDKFLGIIRQGFGGRTWDHLVAISDEGNIRMKPESRPRPECLLKAEAVPDRIHALIKGHSSFTAAQPRFDPDEMESIAHFLLDHHRPLHAVKAAPVATVTPEIPTLDSGATLVRASNHRHEEQDSAMRDSLPKTQPRSAAEEAVQTPVMPQAPSPVCGKCGSSRVTVQFGHSYYLKCHACDANTPIRSTCPTCGARERISRRAEVFTATCAACGGSRTYHRNPVSA